MDPASFAIAVEGGGLRGAFSAGALATLYGRLPAQPAKLFATSAGAPSAAYFATDHMDEALRVWRQHTCKSELVSPAHFLKGRPLMDVDRLVGHFRAPGGLDAARLQTCQSEIFVTLTNCETGQAQHVKLTQSNVFPVLTASMALPIAYGRTVDVGGTPYVDGGIGDSIPFQAALDSGAEHVLVILTQPLGYRKKRSRLSEAFVRLQYPAHPNLQRAYASRPVRYNQAVERLAELEKQGRVSVIRPDAPLPASRLTRDPRRIAATIEHGQRAAEAWLCTRGVGTR